MVASYADTFHPGIAHREMQGTTVSQAVPLCPIHHVLRGNATGIAGRDEQQLNNDSILKDISHNIKLCVTLLRNK